MPVLDRKELEESPLSDLHAIASELGIEGYRRLRREELIDALAGDGGGGAADKPKPKPRSRSKPKAAEEDEEKAPPRRRARRTRQPRAEETPKAAERDEDSEDDSDAETEVREGVLDILPNGSGFMRPDAFVHSRDDVYVSPAQIRRCELRAGDQIEGPVRSPRRNERHPSLVRVDKVNGGEAEQPAGRPRFEELTPVFATQALTSPDGLDATPFGRGSRVAVGGPSGSGITTLLRRIALSLAAAHPDVELTVLLAGVRPEEVTEWKRDSEVTVVGGGFDRSMDEQSQIAEAVVERAKRRAESGAHAAIVLDSLDALPPAVARRVFGAARCLEEGGSVTVVASTGMAGEPQRLATTRIVLEAGDPDPHPPALAQVSGTLRADRLG